MYNMVILDCSPEQHQHQADAIHEEHHVFPDLRFGEKLSERMTEKMLEEKRLLQVGDDYRARIYSQKLRELEELRKEICDPVPVHGDGADYDCVGYHPTDSLVAVLSKVIKTNRDKSYRILLGRVAEICREYADIFKDVGLWQFKFVADSLFEDGMYTPTRMYVLWFITKLKSSKQMKAKDTRLWERTELWSHLQVRINSYIAYAISHPRLVDTEEGNPRRVEMRNWDWGIEGCRRRLHLQVREECDGPTLPGEQKRLHLQVREECDGSTSPGEQDVVTQQSPPNLMD